jgi:serine/threonine protein kinase/Tfp pilus assembly protein PilF
MAIKCPKCHSENPETASFCADCGTSLSLDKGVSASVTKTLISPIEGGGRYKILGKLGEGGMGVVYKAEDTRLKRTVALKFLPPELTRESEAKERFIREAQAAAALSHPHICTIYEVHEEDGKSFISMEYVEGESIRESIKKRALDPAMALGIAMQVAQGLEEAHKKGIIHRDIKTANIMVTSSGQAKVMDFGLAKVFGASLITKEAKTMGTVAYMSPEQAQGQSLDQRTDIWSLGIVLYEMLTGKLPFKGEYDQSMVHSILNHDPEPLRKIQPNLPKELENVVLTALAKNPAARYQSMKEMLEDLKAIAEGQKPLRVKTKPLKGISNLTKRHWLWGAVVVTIVAAFAIAFLVIVGGRKTPGIDSIAVLPLKNLSGDPEQEYFADGMTEALITQLSQISGLGRVISRTSIMAYKNVQKRLPEIARELNVDVVAEGTVFREGDRVRITIRLIDALKDRNMWSKDYERNLDDVIVLQKEVAQSIAHQVNIILKPDEEARLTSKQFVNPRAFDAVLKGSFHRDKLTVEDLTIAKQYFEKAIEIDPNFAQAYVGLAGVFDVLSLITSMPPGEAFPKAKAAAEKALKLNESLGEAHAALAWALAIYDWDWLGADQAWTRALELQPGSSTIHQNYGWFLSWMGRHDEAIAESRGAVELDPFSVRPITNLSIVLTMARRFDEALEAARRAIEMDPTYYLAYVRVAEAYKGKKMYEEAIASLQKTADLSGGSLLWKTCLGHAYAVAGRKEEAMKILDELLDPSNKGKVFSEYIALIYAGLGEKEKALPWLERACEAHDPNMVMLKAGPAWDPLRDEPRFQDLLRRMNFPK